ncbi:ribonuclease Z, partial [Candidatus Parvarchaeota archaeon]|nr:ribonuclease Z [Candidatus Parvarchaeota archaeon]
QMFTQIQKQGHVMVGKRKIRLEQVARKVQGRKIVYTGDTQPCKSTISAALGADILFHDSSFSGQQEAEAKATKHSTISQAAAVAKQAGVARLVAIHISPRYGEPALLEKEAQEIFPATTISFDGMEILLKP